MVSSLHNILKENNAFSYKQKIFALKSNQNFHHFAIEPLMPKLSS